MNTRRNKPRDMRYIHKHKRANLVANLTNALEVDYPRVRACAGNEHFRLALYGDFFHFVVVDNLRFLAYAVGNDIEIFTRNIYGRAVRKVSAVRQIHTHNSVAGLKSGEKHRQVCACARMGLNVAVLATENLFNTFARQIFGNIHKLTAAVVAVSGISLGILIG